MKRLLLMLLVVLGVSTVACSAWAAKEVTDPDVAKQDPDFAIQGEYLGEGTLKDGGQEKVGAQVIARGGGQFEAVVYKGGLPGAGWQKGDESARLQGTAAELKGETLSAKIEGDTLTVTAANGEKKVELQKVERKSPTLGAAPPEDACVLFDGSSVEGFTDHEPQMSPDGNLISGVTTKAQFDGSYALHLEFRLSWMPEADGQKRSNSGVYLHDAYEIQVLDSFGLEGKDNECGGLYSIKAPDVNACLPPMTWQTYDIQFTAPKYENGEKVASARLTLKHNGIVIHDNLELPKGTPGRKGEGPGPRPIHLQGHGNHVQYRNIWVAPKSAVTQP